MTTAPILEAMPQVEPAKPPLWSTRRIPELDGLRGLAILMVLVRHYFYETHFFGASHWLSHPVELSSLTWSGVDLFFVLSGFLIGGILLDHRGSANYFKTFYARRAFRIIPVYAVVVSAYYLCLFAEEQTWIPASRWLFGANVPWYSYATFTQNFQWAAGGAPFTNWLTATWSLAVEEQFYLILPAILWFVSGRKLLNVLGAVVVGAPFLRLLLALHFRSGLMASFCLMPCRADSLLLGVAAAVLVRNPWAWERVKLQRLWVVAAWVVLLAGLPFFVYFKQADPVLSFWMTTVGFSWMGFFYLGLLLLGLIYSDGWLGKILRNSWLKALGTISYGVYLIHKPVLGLIFDFYRVKWPWAETTTERLLVLSALAVTFAVASFSWTFFEKPLLKIGQNMKY
jgi:peptidoglycan/LPS O-acetylase OafA/YrhL